MCENVLFLVVFKIVNSIIAVAKIALPLIIIVMGSLDLVKFATKGTQEEFTAAMKKFAYRFVAAVVIFFLPTIVKALMNTLITDLETYNIDCLFNVTEENISLAKTRNATEAVQYAEENPTYQNYEQARRYINRVTDEAQKSALTTKNEAIKEKLDAEMASQRASVVEEAKKKKSSKNTGNGSSFAIDKTGNEIVDYALGFVGKRYVFGGPCGRSQPDLDSCYASGSATDCSGFVTGVYYHFGVDLRDGGGTSTYTLINKGTKVNSISEAKPGDLIFYGTENSHVAMYMGNDQIVHAQCTKCGIVTSPNASTYNHIYGIRRIID